MPQRSIHCKAKLENSRALGWYLNDRYLRALFCAALVLTVLGARLWIIGKFGSDLPYWDQWDAEGGGLYKAFFDKTLTLNDWFGPHNEHRIFFSRVLALALLVANGQWDARLQMVVNAAVYALFAGGLYLVYTDQRERPFAIACCAAVALVFSLPLGWENTVAGFQSQFYFLAAFSVAAIWLLGNYRAWTRHWTAGCLFALAALFCMASGMMAPLALLGLYCLTLARDWRNWRGWLKASWPSIAACLLIATAGLFLMVTVKEHAGYRAQSIGDFMGALAAVTAWPCSSLSWWAPGNWLPLVVLGGLYLNGSLRDGRRERLALGMGIWLLLQFVATALARSTIVLSVRYLDLVSLGLLLNFLCLYLIATGYAHTRKTKFALGSFFLLWMVLNGRGLYQVSRVAFASGLPSRSETYSIEKFRTSGYLRTGDGGFLTVGLQRKTDIPYPRAERFAEILGNPAIRAILPASVRGPMALDLRGGNPALRNVVNTGLQPPFSWEWGMDLPVPGSGSPAKTDYSAFKTLGLPILFLYVNGDCRQLVVIDRQQGRHAVTSLAPGAGLGWQPAYAYCPGPECRMAAASAGRVEAVSFTEPKEMGLLSLCAILATENAVVFMVLGALFFCGALALTLWKQQAPSRAEGDKTCGTC